jgi:hypothetical protein
LAKNGERRGMGLRHSGIVVNETEAISRRVPSPKEKPFIVQCSGFRCMAYCDSRGKWRDYFNGEEIQGEITIIAEG